MAGRLGPALTAAVFAAIGAAMIYPIDDLDVWWLLRSGAYMVETRSFPTTDPFSDPAFGAPWVNHAWGFELVLYGVYRLAGTTGLVLLQALFAVATFAILYSLLRREGVGRGWALVAIAAGALATRGFWAPRPQLVTYLALAAFWAILRDSRDGRRDRLRWLPVMTAVWANLHGGYMVGPGLIALGLAGEVVDRVLPGTAPAPGAGRPGRLALALGASLLATLATPFHYHAVLFPFQVLGDRLAQAFIIEWASPPFQYGAVRLVEGLILLTLALSVWAPRRCRAGDVIVLAAFFHFGLQALRNLPLLVVVLLPILMTALTETVRDRVPALIAGSGVSPRRFGLAAAAVGLAFVVWWNFPARGVRDALPRVGVAQIFPAGAVEYLKRARPPGPLFNDYGWGGYLIWRLYPDYRVSIDGRMAVHGPQRFADHIEVAEVRPRWRETLDRLGARVAVVHTNSPLAIVLGASPDWEVLYQDKVAVVLGKRAPRS
ncbi:MAG: hypothetical protein HY359_02455 [Candidatus Rokubacteria bacterium]|nr:hypothetical protein [Candidatus Rokubacteria bacterium]